MNLENLLEKNKNKIIEMYKFKNENFDFHTDNVKFLVADFGDGIFEKFLSKNKEILNNLQEESYHYEIMNSEDYNNTILANANHNEEGEFPRLIIGIANTVEINPFSY